MTHVSWRVNNARNCLRDTIYVREIIIAFKCAGNACYYTHICAELCAFEVDATRIP